MSLGVAGVFWAASLLADVGDSAGGATAFGSPSCVDQQFIYIYIIYTSDKHNIYRYKNNLTVIEHIFRVNVINTIFKCPNPKQ